MEPLNVLGAVAVEGYLTYKEKHPPRTLLQAYFLEPFVLPLSSERTRF